MARGAILDQAVVPYLAMESTVKVYWPVRRSSGAGTGSASTTSWVCEGCDDSLMAFIIFILIAGGSGPTTGGKIPFFPC